MILKSVINNNWVILETCLSLNNAKISCKN